jgi:ABC-type branched-subunit amino acid transport system ATPase component
MTASIELSGVSVRFGGIHALDNVSLAVPPRQIRGIIGPNGSGKSTLVNVASRVVDPAAGTVRLDGKDITGFPTHAASRLGIVRTFQRVELVGQLSVLENVMLGAAGEPTPGVTALALRLPFVRARECELVERAQSALAFVGIERLANQRGNELSGGQMRLVEFARAIMARPRILLLDEPAAGLSLPRIDRVRDLILKINNDLGVTVILVEHVLNLVMTLSQQVSVLVSGKLLCEGTPEAIRADARVREAYLGRRGTV